MSMRIAWVAAVVGFLIACGACGDAGPTPEEKLRRTLIDFNGHVVVMKAESFSGYRDVLDVVRREPGVTSATPIAFFEATLHAAGGKSRAIAIKGIAPEATPLSKRLTPPDVLAGYRPPAGTDPVHVVIGLALARDLDLHVGDVVRIVIPAPMDLETWKPRDPVARDVRVVGMLRTHEEYDERTLLTTFEAAQALQGAGDRVLGLEVRVADQRAAARIARAIEERLGPPFEAIDWCELNQAVLRCEL